MLTALRYRRAARRDHRQFILDVLGSAPDKTPATLRPDGYPR
jgi:hypothetical protein